ncbi:peptidoglycan editing factor PgeF [Sulfurimonas sp.]
MKFYQSILLKKYPNIRQQYTTKKSGNLAFHVGDEKSNVLLNHAVLAKELDYNLDTLVHMRQIHSNQVKIITDLDNFDNPPTCDALITNKKEIPLMVMVADCAPLLFYDSLKNVIAVAHAGRAGAFKNIIKNVIETFSREYNSNPSNISVLVGPSIGVCCYEVGEEIYLEAKQLKLDFAIERRDNSYFLDIKKILKKQLLEQNIKEENIELSEICNACKEDIFYSYRVKNKTGRFAGIIFLK